jgi:hypothetical protein
VAPAPFDAAAQERAYYEINLELQRDYIRHLSAALAACEEGRGEVPGGGAGEAGRGWRLYQRLRRNPFVRRLWRLVSKPSAVP